MEIFFSALPEASCSVELSKGQGPHPVELPELLPGENASCHTGTQEDGVPVTLSSFECRRR